MGKLFRGQCYTDGVFGWVGHASELPFRRTLQMQHPAHDAQRRVGLRDLTLKPIVSA